MPCFLTSKSLLCSRKCEVSLDYSLPRKSSLSSDSNKTFCMLGHCTSSAGELLKQTRSWSMGTVLLFNGEKPSSFAASLRSKRFAECPGMHWLWQRDTVLACSWNHVSFGDTQQSHDKAAAYPNYTGLLANDPFAWAPPCFTAVVVLVLNMDLTTSTHTAASWAVGTGQDQRVFARCACKTTFTMSAVLSTIRPMTRLSGTQQLRHDSKQYADCWMNIQATFSSWYKISAACL